MGSKKGERREIGSVRKTSEDGVMISERVEVERVWKSYFDHLMNERMVGEAAMTSIGMEEGGL